MRGIYASLWTPLAILHLFLLVPCIFFWGAIEGMLFTCFSLALVSIYAGLGILLVDGFPFGNAFKPHVVAGMPMIYLAAIPILFFAAIQWLVFNSSLLVLVAAIVLSLLGYAIARFNLGRLENTVRVNLTQLGFLPTEMFRELE